MSVILPGLAPVLKWLVMKKDSELPWSVRVARWVVTVFGSLWLIGYVTHSFQEWFL